MDTEIIIIYCLVDEMLTAMDYRDDPQAQMTSAEVMTTAIVAGRYFGGNCEHARALLGEHGYIRRMLSRSRLNRRLHAIPLGLWQSCLSMLGRVFQQRNQTAEYIIDSVPVPVCDNIRIRSARLVRDEVYRGRMAGKRRYFYGVRIHLLATAEGTPVEVQITPGATHDGVAFENFDCDLEPGATIYADKIYNDAQHEELLLEHGQMQLLPLRKTNMRHQFPPWVRYIQGRIRQRIEPSFSRLTALFPKSIHAVRFDGFLVKLFAFILAFAIDCL